MKNKTSKVNKTKFDYICFRLGIVGLALFLLTIVIGGASLFNIINTNQELAVAMTQSERVQNQVQSQEADDIVIID